MSFSTSPIRCVFAANNDVDSSHVQFPIGTWGEDERHRGLGGEVRRYTKGFVRGAKDMFRKGGWTEDDFEALRK
jgi:hypothetical protein